MKKVLITGVAGMIGSHLLDELMQMGYLVVGIDNLSFGKVENIEKHLSNDNFIFHKADILDLNQLENIGKGADIIIHLASVKKVGEADSCMATLEVNGTGTLNVLKIASKNGSKVVLASTSDVYGVSTDLPFREDGNLCLGPSHIKRWGYAVAKLFSEQVAFAFHQDNNIPIVILRYFGGFSPRSHNCWVGGHVPIFIDAILNNQTVSIHGDGSQTRSMSYVDDLVHGTILAMESEHAVGEIINIGNNYELSVLDTAILIHKIANTGHPLKLDFIPIPEVFGDYKEIPRRKPDLRKARKLLGYQSLVSLEDGLNKVVEAWKSKAKDDIDSAVLVDYLTIKKIAEEKLGQRQYAS